MLKLSPSRDTMTLTKATSGSSLNKLAIVSNWSEWELKDCHLQKLNKLNQNQFQNPLQKPQKKILNNTHRINVNNNLVCNEEKWNDDSEMIGWL